MDGSVQQTERQMLQMGKTDRKTQTNQVNRQMEQTNQNELIDRYMDQTAKSVTQTDRQIDQTDRSIGQTDRQMDQTDISVRQMDQTYRSFRQTDREMH